jgi:hypothetical protein
MGTGTPRDRRAAVGLYDRRISGTGLTLPNASNATT